MNRSLIFLLSSRYLQAALYKRNMRILLISVCLSIAAASCAIVIVHSITQGFEQATMQSLQGMHPDIIISTDTGHLALERMEQVLRTEFPQIKTISPYNIEQGILKSGTKGIRPSPTVIKIIDPLKESRTGTFDTMCRNQKKPFTELCTPSGGIIIGSGLASSLYLAIHDKTELIVALQEEDADTVSLVSIPVHIGGILKTGIDEIDSTVVMMDYAWYRHHNTNAGFSHIGLRCGNQKACYDTVRKRFSELTVYRWQDLYPSLVDALTLEKYAFTIIMFIIMSIASITIMAIITLIINTKNTDLALLYLCGASPQLLKKIFITIALMINSIASLLGIGLAWLIILFLRIYPVPLPDAYYVKTLPMCFNPASTLLVFIYSTMLTAIIAFATTTLITNTSLIGTVKQES